MYSLILRTRQFAVLPSHYCCNYSLRLMDGRAGIRRTAYGTRYISSRYRIQDPTIVAARGRQCILCCVPRWRPELQLSLATYSCFLSLLASVDYLICHLLSKPTARAPLQVRPGLSPAQCKSGSQWATQLLVYFHTSSPRYDAKSSLYVFCWNYMRCYTVTTLFSFIS